MFKAQVLEDFRGQRVIYIGMSGTCNFSFLLLFPTSMDDREDEVLGELGKQYTKSILEVLLRASTYGGAKKVRKSRRKKERRQPNEWGFLRL